MPAKPAKHGRSVRGIGRICINAGLAAISVMSVLLILEFSFRLVRQDDFRRWMVGPEWSKVRACFAYCDGESMFRELYQDFKPLRVNILITGDSFTFGDGIPDYNDVYSAILARKLESVYPVQVNNAARGGFDVHSAQEMIRRLLATISPDIVVYGLNLNDIVSKDIQNEFEMGRSGWDGRLMGGIPFLRNSYLFFDASFRINRLIERLTGTEYGESIRKLYIKKESEWQAFSNTIRNIRDLCKADRKRLLIAILPLFVDFDDYPFTEIHEQIGALLDEYDMEYIDLLNAFHGTEAREFWVNPYDSHPNESAQKIIADALYPRMAEMVHDARPAAQSREGVVPRRVCIVDLQRVGQIFKSPDTIDFLKRKIQEFPGEIRYHYNLAFAYQVQKKYAESIGVFRKAVSMAKDSTDHRYQDALLQLGALMMVQRQFKEAIERMARYREFNPANPSTIDMLSIAYRETGDLARAEAVLNEGIQINPHHPNHYEYLANLYFDSGNIDAARRTARKAEMSGIKIDTHLLSRIDGGSQ